MKQKDWALVLVMAFVGAVVSLLASNFLFSSAKNKQSAETVDAISASFPAPPSKYFNSEATNPTQPIKIGDSNNQNPFNSGTQ
ncbi:MAG TPA: hypothetical protein VLF62_04640 [Candidatus Saccharimonadales bacterium]|nr:hypothetical protein [Candidatus Saccharimonadales bacterium]